MVAARLRAERPVAIALAHGHVDQLLNAVELATRDRVRRPAERHPDGAERQQCGFGRPLEHGQQLVDRPQVPEHVLGAEQRLDRGDGDRRIAGTAGDRVGLARHLVHRLHVGALDGGDDAPRRRGRSPSQRNVGIACAPAERRRGAAPRRVIASLNVTITAAAHSRSTRSGCVRREQLERLGRARRAPPTCRRARRCRDRTRAACASNHRRRWRGRSPVPGRSAACGSPPPDIDNAWACASRASAKVRWSPWRGPPAIVVSMIESASSKTPTRIKAEAARSRASASARRRSSRRRAVTASRSGSCRRMRISSSDNAGDTSNPCRSRSVDARSGTRRRARLTAVPTDTAPAPASRRAVRGSGTASTAVRNSETNEAGSSMTRRSSNRRSTACSWSSSRRMASASTHVGRSTSSNAGPRHSASAWSRRRTRARISSDRSRPRRRSCSNRSASIPIPAPTCTRSGSRTIASWPRAPRRRVNADPCRALGAGAARPDVLHQSTQRDRDGRQSQAQGEKSVAARRRRDHSSTTTCGRPSMRDVDSAQAIRPHLTGVSARCNCAGNNRSIERSTKSGAASTRRISEGPIMKRLMVCAFALGVTLSAGSALAAPGGPDPGFGTAGVVTGGLLDTDGALAVDSSGRHRRGGLDRWASSDRALHRGRSAGHGLFRRWPGRARIDGRRLHVLRRPHAR